MFQWRNGFHEGCDDGNGSQDGPKTETVCFEWRQKLPEEWSRTYGNSWAIGKNILIKTTIVICIIRACIVLLFLHLVYHCHHPYTHLIFMKSTCVTDWLAQILGSYIEQYSIEAKKETSYTSYTDIQFFCQMLVCIYKQNASFCLHYMDDLDINFGQDCCVVECCMFPNNGLVMHKVPLLPLEIHEANLIININFD